MATWKFYGCESHSPMEWGVQQAIDGGGGRWVVVESYNGGKDWIANSAHETEQGAWDFISAWFSQFYGH